MQEIRHPDSLVLAAHGSRCGTAAHALEQMAGHFRREARFQQVLTGYHQGRPAFSEIQHLVHGGSAVVVPVFLAEGYYSRKVLPRELLRSPRARPLELWLTPVVGADDRLRLAVLKRVRLLMGRLTWDRADTAVIVLGHGTPRSSTSARSTRETVQFLLDADAAKTVRAAFLDDDPSPRKVLQAMTAKNVLVLPFLFGRGDHARELAETFGLPEAAESNLVRITGRDPGGREVAIDRPVGEDPVLGEIIRDLVRSPRSWTQLDSAGGSSHAA